MSPLLTQYAHHQHLLPVVRSDFDDSMSGTTAITVLIRGRSLLVANVGDSRAVLAEKVPGGGYIAKDLSIDQTPYR